MMYNFFIDGVRLPVSPSKLTLKINNKNKTLDLMDLGEINIIKKVGLTDISFEVLLPSKEYSFAVYDGNGFKEPKYYLEKLKSLKKDNKPFRLNISRFSPVGDYLFSNYMKVSLERYSIVEEAENGMDIMVSIELKEYKSYSTKIYQIVPEQNKLKKENQRPSKDPAKSYTVKAGDTLWGICKKQLGDGSQYAAVAQLNHIKNPNLILPGQILRLE